MSDLLPELDLAHVLSDPGFAASDRALANYLEWQFAETSPWIKLAAACANAAARSGHAYIDLQDPANLANLGPAFPKHWPSPEAWTQLAVTSPAVGDGNADTPLVLVDTSCLYLKKYYDHEQTLANLVRSLCQDPSFPITQPPEPTTQNPTPTTQHLEPITPNPKTIVDRSLHHRLFVITGGPGTGKTTLALQYLAKFLAAWQLEMRSKACPESTSGSARVSRASSGVSPEEQPPSIQLGETPSRARETRALPKPHHDGELGHSLNRVQQHDQPPRIAAVAPTGKAAARLAESIASGLENLDAPEGIKATLQQTPCLTIHRLLGSQNGKSSFRHNARNPIDCDLLVADEVSMIDLPLMRRLFEAMPPDCRILLLGDADQLASVEVGSVLSDFISAGQKDTSPLHGRVARLEKTYRFSEDSSIYRLCQLARQSQQEAFAQFIETEAPDFHFEEIAPDASRPPAELIRKAAGQHARLHACRTPEAALQHLTDSIILSPTRTGPFGTIALNAEIERQLRQTHDLQDDEPIHGQAILILENNYDLEIFNGDLGLVWIDAETSQAFAHFATAADEPRRFRLADLPRHESAFALSIHKSQGSEFEEVSCLFGPSDSRNITRELLYTAFSRARKTINLFAETRTLLSAIARQAHRATRLEKLLSRQSRRPID